MAEGVNKIDDINDCVKMVNLMKLLEISGEGLQSLVEMKETTKQTLQQRFGSSSNWTTDFSVISSAKDEDTRKRKELHEIYSQTKACLDRMNDDKVFTVLSSEIPNIKETITERQRRLELREYYLLVAGETSAGKSSLLNQILGEEVLPSAHLETTSIICELRYDTERRLVAHLKDTHIQGQAYTLSIPLKKSEECDGMSYSEQISPYVHVEKDREKGSEYTKVEIFWPHELLKNGIVIIDSPGIGESDVMDKTLIEYLPKAFAFIYVINSANAGGVQKDRVIRIFDEVRKLVTEEEEQQCLAECALFVRNKWDLVPVKERDKVKKDGIEKLQLSWPDVNPDTQIVYLSTTKVMELKEFGICTPEFVTLMKHIGTMVLGAIHARLHSHWEWLDRVLLRLHHQIRLFIHNTENSRQNVTLKMDTITTRRFQEIQQKENEVENDLKKQLSDKINNTTLKLSKHLRSDDFKKAFTTWSTQDAPAVEKTWDLTKREINKVFDSRMRELLQNWEDEHKEFATAHTWLVQHFLNKLNLIEKDLQEIEDDLVGENLEDNQQLMEDKSELSTTRAKVLAGVTSPFWIPLGMAGLVVGIPLLGAVFVKNALHSMHRQEKYRENRCAYLEKRSQKYLVAFNSKGKTFEHNRVFEYVKDRMGETERILKGYIERIPRLMESDKKLVSELRDETRTNKQVQTFYRPILEETSKIRETLTEFALTIHPSTIESSALEWKFDTESCIGTGISSNVFKGTFNNSQPVAIKVLKNPLDASNARIFCREEHILRKLNHAHVVKLYGTLSVMPTSEHMFVMELCQGNLEQAIFIKNTPPAQSSKEIDRVLKWATQIADGLKYIHAKGLYHRHLCLENILVTDDEGSVKISDVGIRSNTIVTEKRIVYYAPEVIKQMFYTDSADIYSFGMILWEMWYGKHVFSELMKQPFDDADFNHKISRGYRPYTPRSTMVKLPELEDLMQKCWDSTSDGRPTACNCYLKLEVLFKEFRADEKESSNKFRN